MEVNSSKLGNFRQEYHGQVHMIHRWLIRVRSATVVAAFSSPTLSLSAFSRWLGTRNHLRGGNNSNVYSFITVGLVTQVVNSSGEKVPLPGAITGVRPPAKVFADLSCHTS